MMRPVECEFEVDVLAGVLEGRWPAGIEPGLQKHVSQCAICSEVVAIADRLAVEKRQLQEIAVLPDASRLWWTAQIRARREATQDAARPILATQIVAGIWIAGLLFVCIGVALSLFQTSRSWIESVSSMAGTILLGHAIPLGIAAMIVILLPTAAYFAMGKE